MFGLLTVLAGVGGRMLSSAVGTMVSKALTEKVVIRIILLIADKLVASSKNKLDDKILKELKKALEESV